VEARAFRPNPTTVRFARAIEIKPGDIVFDIGTGVGPLAIMAAMRGAGSVIAVDPVEMHCELARRNIERYGFSATIDVHCGEYFQPFQSVPALRGMKANVIIGDVSGIADRVSHALGWYSDIVPTGGEDGTATITSFLRQAGRHLLANGTVYFPIAVDLSDGDRIVSAAREAFEEVENAFPEDYIRFPMSDQEVAAVRSAYDGALPPYITIQQEGSRTYWRGQICRARGPRP
jgi:methylase of polypeptide subunit release factors